MNQNLTPEQRKERLENIIKIAGLVGVCIILGPLYFTILHGLGAIAALIVGGAAVFTVGKFLPWFAMKIGNARLKAMKAEAAKNPVETLQNQLVDKRKALDSFKDNIRIFTGQVLTFADEVKKYVKDGLEDAQTYVEQLAKMRQLLELRKQKYQEAEQMLVEFEKTIERTDRKWKMALSAAAMNEAAGQIAGDVFDKICIETALDSVQQKLNQSFADLEIALLDENKDKAKQLYAEKQQQMSQNIMTDSSAPVKSERQKIAV